MSCGNLNGRSPALRHLAYLAAFEAVARLGSVARAAEELRLSPSAVSLQLAKLAQAMGTELLVRAGRGLELTPAGRDLARLAARVIAEMAEAAAPRPAAAVAPPRALALGMPPSLGIAWGAAAALDLAEEAGVRTLTIRSALRAAEIDWRGLDLAIVYDNPPFEGLSWSLLSEVRLRPVCAPVIFPRIDRQRRERRLEGIALLHEDQGQEWARWAAAAQIGLGGARDVFLPSVALAVAAAVQGRGLALVSDVLTAGLLIDGRLIQPFATSVPASRAYYVATPVARAEDPWILRVTAALRQTLRRALGPGPHVGVPAGQGSAPPQGSAAGPAPAAPAGF